ERVEAAVQEALQDLVDAPIQVERVGAARADDRAATGQDPRDRGGAEVAEVPVHEASPALERSDRVPARGVRRADDRADHGVQSGAIAAAREDAYGLSHALSHTDSILRMPRWGDTEVPVHDRCCVSPAATKWRWSGGTP